jgi:hypothetical protein
MELEPLGPAIERPGSERAVEEKVDGQQVQSRQKEESKEKPLQPGSHGTGHYERNVERETCQTSPFPN